MEIGKMVNFMVMESILNTIKKCNDNSFYLELDIKETGIMALVKVSEKSMST